MSKYEYTWWGQIIDFFGGELLVRMTGFDHFNDAGGHLFLEQNSDYERTM